MIYKCFKRANEHLLEQRHALPIYPVLATALALAGAPAVVEDRCNLGMCKLLAGITHEEFEKRTLLNQAPHA
jgi:hypothetical protein